MEQKINSGNRFASMILDHFIMALISMIFFIPQFISDFSDPFKQTTLGLFSGINFILPIGFALYFCKDCINGRSIAKRVLKLQIIDNKTGESASALKCFIRNIFIIIWPIEGIVALINPSRRIGDYVAGTKLVPFDPSAEQKELNFGNITISLILAYSFMLLVMLPFFQKQPENSAQGAKIITESYNEAESKAVEKIFADSLSNYITAKVKVYDRIEKYDLKYVAVYLELKENLLENEMSFSGIENESKRLVYTQFPRNTFVGQVKFVYMTPGSIQSRVISLELDETK